MAFKPRVFLKPSLMTWDGNKITDHNRGELGVSYERIEEKQRMANGTLRRYVIADKRTFSVSWKELPQSKAFTVDGFWGKNEMENWWDTMPGSFLLRLNFGDGTFENIDVMMSKFDADIEKRGAYDFWNVSVELEEV